MNNAILVAEDEFKIRRLISDYLKKDGFSVTEAENGREALDFFYSFNNFSLVILDIMMPEYDGWRICKEIRKKSSIPIIILTARCDEFDELFGFELGADEYIKKPFSPRILMARVHALLKRSIEKKVEYINHNGLEINQATHQVKIDNKPINLSPREYKLLIYLSSNKNIVLSREQILDKICDYNYCGDGRAVDTHIKTLRLKLGNKRDFIQTIRGFGYRFEEKK